MNTELTNPKTKVLYLMKVLYEETDESHAMTMPEIIKALEKYGIYAERKSIYYDMEILRIYGVDIIGEKDGRSFRYYIGSRQFELAELKLLADSVQAAKFITEKKSKELIRKIESLTSRYEASKINRQVYISNRLKADNETIFYCVDDIHQAIAANRQISFQYFNWDIKKNQVLRRNGDRYNVSPWALSWDNENYYLIAFDGEEGKIKHFRVDKIVKLKIEDAPRLGAEAFKNFDMARYSKKVFGMFGGTEENVMLECDNDMAGVIIDRFGKGVTMIPKTSEKFVVNVPVEISSQFFSWIMAFGSKITIAGPEKVYSQMQAHVSELAKTYKI